MTQKEIILRSILLNDYERGREMGLKILDHILAHPDCLREARGAEAYQDRFMQALENSFVDVLGHNLRHYQTRCKTQDLCDGRMMAILLMRRNGGFSLNEIGRFFNKNHSTILHSFANAQDLLNCDRKFALVFNELKRTFDKNYEESNL